MVLKVFLFLLLSGGIFAATTFTTIGVQQATKKNPTVEQSENNSISIEDEYSFEELSNEPPTPQEIFVTNLTTFGNLEATLNVDITYQEENFTIFGDAFVSLETLTTPKIYADLSIQAFNKEIPLQATFLDNELYLNISDNLLMLNIDDIGELTSLFGDVNFEDILPSELSSIDAMVLLDRLSEMTMKETTEGYIFTCSLFDFLPDFVFTSDKDFNLTGLSVEDIQFGDLSIDLHASAHVLGMGKNQVFIPENAADFVNLKEYFPIVKQIKSYINNKELSLGYDIKAYQDEANIISTNGDLYLNFSNGIVFDANGKLDVNYEGIKLSPSYQFGYDGSDAYININDVLKGKLSASKFDATLDMFSTLLGNDTLPTTLDITLPVLEMVSSGDYKGLINTFKGLSITKDGISLTLSNTLLSNNESDITIVLGKDDNGLTDITISNLAYNNYHLDIALYINETKAPEKVDLANFIDISNYFNIISQVTNLISNPKLGLDVSLSLIKDNQALLNVDGNLNIDINNRKGNGSLTIASENDIYPFTTDIALNINNERACFDLLNNKLLFNYSDMDTLLEKVSPLLGNVSLPTLDSFSLPILEKINEKDYASIISYISSISFKENEINLALSNSMLGNNETNYSLSILLDEGNIDTLVISNLSYEDFILNASLSLKDYEEKEIDESNYTDISTYFSIIDQVEQLLENKNLGLNYQINLDKNEESFVATSGNLNLHLEDLKVLLNGSLTFEQYDLNYSIAYNENNLLINYNDLLKFQVHTDKISSIIDAVKQLLKTFEIELNSLDLGDFDLPIISYIADKDYASIINNVKLNCIDAEHISIAISNSLFYEQEGDIIININIDENGIKGLEILNAKYQEYCLSTTFELCDYKAVEINTTNYIPLDNVSALIEQVNSIITNKEIGATFEVEYDAIKATGELNVKFNDGIDLSADIVLDVNGNSYVISVQKDGDDYYLVYDENLYITIDTTSLNSIIDDLKKLYEDKDSILYNYISEISFDTNINIDIKDLLFNLPISNVKYEEGVLSFDLDLSFLNVDYVINLVLSFNDNHQLGNIEISAKINEKDLNSSLSIKDYDKKQYEPIGGWIGASSLSNGVHYLTSLTKENQEALINQIQSYMDVDKLSLGVDYDIKVTRDNKLTFTTKGTIDLAKENEDFNIALIGDLVNKEDGINIDSTFHINYEDDTIYFNYNDDLKLSYEKASILALVDIISSRLPNSLGLEAILEKLLPDISTMSCPLFTLIGEGNYIGLASYFKGCYIDNNFLVIVIDASILGDIEGELSIALDASNGIKEITIKNVYAFGYILDFDLKLRDYQTQTLDKEGYTTLNYVNNIFETILDLVDENQYALSLSGSLKTGDKNIGFNGTTQFTLSDTLDRGIGKLTIVDNSNKNHNIIIDVTRNKVNKDASEEEQRIALYKSDVLFTYNNNLKGTFNLGSLSETFSVLKEFAKDNPRLQKYADLLSADFSNSVIHQILNGNVEAILYQNLLNYVTRDGNNYIISISGNFLKKNVDIDVSDIIITIKCDSNNKLLGLSFQGKILDYDLDLSLNLTDYDSSYTGLVRNNTYFDFSDMGTLVEYLLNTASKDDFTLSAKLKLSILGDLNMKGYVHIDKDDDGIEKVYAQAIISNIPYIIGVSEETWDDRTFTIYFTDDEVYLDVYFYNNGFLGIGEKEVHKNMRLTLKQFGENIIEYLFTYGLGIKSSLFDKIASDGDSDIDLSKILKSYAYKDNNKEWDITIDMEEIASTSALGDLTLKIYGDEDTKLMKSASGSMSIIGILEISFNGSVTSYDYIGDSKFNEITNFIEKMSTAEYKKNNETRK